MIDTHDIHKSFGSLNVLRGVSFHANDGEVVVIIGPSGTGKSTFLRCLNLIEMPEKGTIDIDDAHFDAEKYKNADVRRLRAKSSMVFQTYNAFKNKTVLGNVMLPMTAVQKMPTAQARERATELLNEVGLSDKLDEYPLRLSGGQQQRVGIARAMAVNADVMLFDEPTSSLDIELIAGILDLIRRLAETHNRTIIIVSHQINFAREVADRLVFMDEGTILEEGTPAQVLDAPTHERTQAFVKSIASLTA